jgi:membrane-associated protein
MIEIIFHIDKYLDIVIKNFGNWSYLLLFVVIFGETGLVIAPILPGDSLLFAVGAFSALGSLSLFWLFMILTAAAIIGDSFNYAFGKFLGKKILQKGDHWFFKKEHLERTHKFYEKHGGKTIILARFLPIIRTFAPFVAGIGAMSYGRFFIYNVVGGLLWVAIFMLGGYYFGNIPVIRENFFITILVIIAISTVPVAIEFWKHRPSKRS